MVDAVLVLGFLALFFSFIYIIVHFSQKIIFKREKVLNKRILYSTAIGGIVLTVIGAGILGADEDVVKVKQLTEENKELNSELESIDADHEEALSELEEQHKTEVAELESKHEEALVDLTEEVEQASDDLEAYEEQIASLEEENEQIDSLNDKVDELSAENKSLKNDISNLESQLASADSSSSTASSGNGSSSSKSESSSEPSGSGSNESSSSSDVQYKNCTEAREAGAAPVYEGDPGYGPHLDRDGDGIGCE